MNQLVKAYLERRAEVRQHKELRRLAGEVREANRKAEPLRRIAEARRRAGVAGAGFVMKPAR